MKGVGELLEGLIPYTQRHFSRIDRLVRSTLLLDYTLTGMSVIEPETDLSELNKKSVVVELKNEDPLEKISSNEQKETSVKDSEDMPLEDNNGKEQKPKEKTSSKKRKAQKSRNDENKKVKGAAHRNISTIPLQA